MSSKKRLLREMFGVTEERDSGVKKTGREVTITLDDKDARDLASTLADVIFASGPKDLNPNANWMDRVLSGLKDLGLWEDEELEPESHPGWEVPYNVSKGNVKR